MQGPDLSWLTPMEVKLGTLNHGQVQAGSISSVADKLRNSEKDAYIPQHISIGPLHIGSTSQLQLMEDPKWRYMSHFLNRPGTPQQTKPQEVRIRDCGTDLLRLDKVIRASYGGNIESHPNEISKMMILDGCFLLELLIRLGDYMEKNQTRSYSDDPILQSEEKVLRVLNDVTKLENQIPFIVLKKLYRKVFPDDSEIPNDHRVAIIARKAFGYPSMNSSGGAAHILDLMHLSTVEQQNQNSLSVQQNQNSVSTTVEHHTLLSIPEEQNQNLLSDQQNQNSVSIVVQQILSKPEQLNQNSVSTVEQKTPLLSTVEQLSKQAKQELLLCATRIIAAGIVISAKPNNTSPNQNQHRLVDRFNFDISFNESLLEIPTLYIKETTEVKWRNLIAWEQRKALTHCKYTSYAFFFKGLICCKHDIELLLKKKIIVNETKKSKGDLLRLFKTISTGTEHMDSSYSDICKRLNEHKGTKVMKLFWEYPILVWHKCRVFIEMLVSIGIKLFRVLKRDHIPTVWKFLGVIGGVALLVMSALQTYYSSRTKNV